MSMRAPRRSPRPPHRLLASLIPLTLAAGLVPAHANEATRLDTMVVTAGGYEQDIKDAPASITVVTRAELEQRQISNLADALRGIEGVDVDGLDARSNKTGNRSISLRGLPAEYTLILIDGRRQNVPGTVAPNAFVDSASVFFPPVAAIERIEVIRGPMSTLYGADALGGVVNIITRKPGKDWAGSVSVDATLQGDSAFGDKYGLEAYLSGPLKADMLSMQLYGRKFEREASDIRFPGQDTSSDRQRTMGQNPVRATVNTAGGKLILSPNSAHELYFGFDVTRQSLNNDRGQMGSIRPGDGYAPKLGFNREQLYLGHTGRLDIGLIETSITRNTTETTGRRIPNAAASAASGRRNTPRTLESETTVFDTKLVTGLGNHLLSVGAQYMDARLTDGIPQTTFKNTQWGIFAEDEWSLRDDLALTLGLRHDRHDVFGGQTTPRAYLTWKANDSWTLKGGVGRGYRAPFLEQLHDGIVGYGNQGQDPLFGNPNLQPEKSTNYELAALYDAGPLTAQMTVFHTDLKNKIERPTGAGANVTANVGEARIQGVEFSARWLLTQALTLSGNYTFIDSEVTTSNVFGINKGAPLFGVPRHSLNAKLDWQATPKLNAFLAAEHRSKRFRPANFHEPHQGGNAQPVDKSFLGDFEGFTVFNLGGAYALTPNVKLNAVVYNLLDKDFNKYKGPYDFCGNAACTTVGGQTYSNIYNNIYEPRRLWLSVSASF